MLSPKTNVIDSSISYSTSYCGSHILDTALSEHAREGTPNWRLKGENRVPSKSRKVRNRNREGKFPWSTVARFLLKRGSCGVSFLSPSETKTFLGPYCFFSRWGPNSKNFFPCFRNWARSFGKRKKRSEIPLKEYIPISYVHCKINWPILAFAPMGPGIEPGLKRPQRFVLPLYYLGIYSLIILANLKDLPA